MAVSARHDTVFEALVRKLGSHTVTNAAELPDGSIVLRYARDLAEIGQPGAQAQVSQAAFDEMKRKIDALIEDRLERERMSDRLDAVEFALLQSLTQEDDEAMPAQYQIAASKSAAPKGFLVALQSAENRIMASLHEAVAQMDLSQPLDAERKTVPSSDHTFSADATAVLARLEDRLASLEQQPAQQLDLTQQRQSFARFLTSIGTVISRLEHCSDQLSAPNAATTSRDRLAVIETAVVNLPAKIDALLDRPDLTAQIARLSEGVDHLRAEIRGLADRPAPKLDLTPQRESFARFATSIAQVVARLERVSDRVESSPAPLAPAAFTDRLGRIEGLLSRGAVPVPTDALTAAIMTLADRIDHRRFLSAPAPEAKILSHELEHSSAILESCRADQDEFFQDLRFVFAELIATQMKARHQGQTTAA